MARHEQGRWCLGFKLPGLPENQGGQTHAPACSTHRHAFSTFLPRPYRLGGSSAFCTRLHTHVHYGGPFNTLAHRLPHPRYHHNSLHQHPCRVDLLFRGPCHCYLGLRLPVPFVVLICLLSLRRHTTRDDDRLPPSVQRHGGEDASVVEGSFGGTPLFYVLAFGAPLGPPRPQECASGAVWRFFRRIFVWHTADSPWTIPLDARASADGVSQQSPPPHGSLRSAASLWPRAFAACTLGSGVRVHQPRRYSPFPHTPV